MNKTKSQYTEKNLSQYGIFQLREIARNVGVHLPTTYKKEELINKILQVVSGEIEPFVAKNKKGRPPKSFISFDSAWKKQEQPAEDENDTFSSWEKGSWVKDEAFSLFAELKVSEAMQGFNKSSQPNIVSGIVFCEPNGFGTLHIGGLNEITNNQMAVINSSIIERFDLQNGDIVTAQIITQGDIQVVCDVVNINGFAPDEIKRQNFAQLETINSNEIIKLWKDDKLVFTKCIAPIGKGQRALVTGDKNAKNVLFEHFANEFSKENIHTIMIALDKRPEEKMNIENSNIEYSFSSFDMIPFRQMYLIELAINHAKRLCELGESVALLVDDLMAVLHAYEFCFKQKSLQESEVDAIISLKKMLAVGRNTSNGGNITLICYSSNRTEEEKKLTQLIDDLCNCHIKVNRSGINDFVVLSDSYTDNAFQLLDNDSLLLADKIKKESNGASDSELQNIYEKHLR